MWRHWSLGILIQPTNTFLFQTSVVHQNQDFKRFIAVYFIFLAVIFFFQMKSHPLGLQWRKLCSRTEAETFKYNLRKAKQFTRKVWTHIGQGGCWVLHFPWWKNMEDSLGEIFSYLLLVFWFTIHLCFFRKYQIFTPLQERDLKCPSHWKLNMNMFLSLKHSHFIECIYHG